MQQGNSLCQRVDEICPSVSETNLNLKRFLFCFGTRCGIFIFLYLLKLCVDCKVFPLHLFIILFSCHCSLTQHHALWQSSGTSQAETPTFDELWISSSSFFYFFIFLPLYLMNEISHAAPLRALAHLGGRALSLYLPSMPTDTLLLFVNYRHTFWEQTHH